MTAAIVRTTTVTGSTGTASTLSFTAAAINNTLLADIEVPNSILPIVSVVDNLGNTYTPDVTNVGLRSGYTQNVYRSPKLTNAPSSIIVTGTSGSFAATGVVQEVSGLDSAPFIASTSTYNGVAGNPRTHNFTTTNDNEFVFFAAATSTSRSITALSPTDFVAWNAAASFQAGASNPDTGVAGAKSVTVTFSATAGTYLFSVRYKAAPIIPVISIGDVTVDRIDGTATVPVTLSSPAPVGGVTVNYATQDDTATAPAYYTAASGTLTFAEGETTKNITVSITA